jgi:hypothetical protein
MIDQTVLIGKHRAGEIDGTFRIITVDPTVQSPENQ